MLAAFLAAPEELMSVVVRQSRRTFIDRVMQNPSNIPGVMYRDLRILPAGPKLDRYIRVVFDLDWPTDQDPMALSKTRVGDALHLSLIHI